MVYTAMWRKSFGEGKGKKDAFFFPAGLRRAAAQPGGGEKRVLVPLTLPERLAPLCGASRSGNASLRQPFFKRTTKHSAQAISLHQPSLHTGNAAVRRYP